MDIKKQYDTIGPRYLQEQQRYFSERQDTAREFIIAALGDVNGKRLLDVGCGGGRDLQLYVSLGAEVFGVDPSEVMVQEAKRLDVAHVALGDWESTGFPDAHFDVVVGRFSLHYLASFDAAYAEVHRVLRPGGRFVFVVDHPFANPEKRKGYGAREIITIQLYDGQVPLSFPSHTIGDYLSAQFLALFTLERFQEGQEEFKTRPGERPDFLGFSAVAR